MALFRLPVFRCGLFLLKAAMLLHYAGALEIYTPNELYVENGTYAKLPCTFKSTDVTSSTTSITWTYMEEGSNSAGHVIFYYIGGKRYAGHPLRFKERVTWAGDINNRDVSIKIDKITFKDNGTYSCSVMNPPDVSSIPKQIKLYVVEKTTSSQDQPQFTPVPEAHLPPDGMEEEKDDLVVVVLPASPPTPPLPLDRERQRIKVEAIERKMDALTADMYSAARLIRSMQEKMAELRVDLRSIQD